MPKSVELRIGDESVTVENPEDYGRAVDKLTDTGEQLRLGRREPTAKEIEGIVHAAEFLTRSAAPTQELPAVELEHAAIDRVRLAMATGALAGVIHGQNIEDTYVQRIEEAYLEALEAAFPVHSPELSEEDREINEIQQRKFEIAKELTGTKTSFTAALDLAGKTPDTDTDVSQLVPQAELLAHDTPPTYDELLERVYIAEGQARPELLIHQPEPTIGQLFDGYSLFNGGDNPEEVSAMVVRAQAITKAQNAAKLLAKTRKTAIDGNADAATQEFAVVQPLVDNEHKAA